MARDKKERCDRCKRYVLYPSCVEIELSIGLRPMICKQCYRSLMLWLEKPIDYGPAGK